MQAKQLQPVGAGRCTTRSVPVRSLRRAPLQVKATSVNGSNGDSMPYSRPLFQQPTATTVTPPRDNGFFQVPFIPAPAPLNTPVDRTFKATGRTVVITGGSQGVGRATALLFAKKGYNVVVAARDFQKLQYVAKDCADVAGRQGASLAVQCDVTSERDVQGLANATLAKYEGVDVVVNCAGIFARGPFADTPAAVAKRLMDTNYLGAYMVAQQFLPILAKEAGKRGWMDQPSLVMVGSFGGKVPLRNMSAFSASKFALAGLTEAIRSEVAPLGVHVSLVHPGFVKSNFMERSEFFGKDPAEERKAFRQVLRALPPLSQSVQEVADAIYRAASSKQAEVTVGLPYVAAQVAYKVTGINVSNMPLIN